MEQVIEALDAPARLFTDEMYGTQVQVHCKDLSFENGNHEPFFLSLALYDIKKKIKISETFHTEVNNDKILMLLGPHLVRKILSTSINRKGNS